MGHHRADRAVRGAFIFATGAAFLALGGCSGGSSAELFSVLPLVFGDGPDSQESFAELVQDSDLVVVGRVTSVSVDPIGAVTPPSGFVTGRYKISIIVTPTGGGQAVTYGESLDVAPDMAESTIREIEGAALPDSEMLFALRGVGDWGYACTSGDPGLCPIQVTAGGLVSPRLEDYLPFGGVINMGGLSVADYVQSLDPNVEIRGGH